MEPHMWSDPWHVMQLLCTTDNKDDSLAQRKRESLEWVSEFESFAWGEKLEISNLKKHNKSFGEY